MRRIRNKNPNCNHNSSTVFYQPHYNNVKYDDSHSKREDVLKKLFFKESSKTDETRTNPISQAAQQIMRNTKQDPHATLFIIEHVLAESMYIKDMNAAVQASRNY